MSVQPLPVFVDAPVGFVSRAQWVLDTLLAPLGREARIVREREAASGCALAYASEPVQGVPTLPCSVTATGGLFAEDRPLPPGSFVRDDATGWPPGAFVAPSDGFAAPFDVVASAFALLACWDEHTSAERDRFGRLPYSASVFAANPALALDDPVVDGYVAGLRHLLTPRLAALDLEALPEAGWPWGDGEAGAGIARPRFAVALTHDLDNLRRYTLGGCALTARRVARALRRGDARALRRELFELKEWATYYLPRRCDPCWTFPQMLAGENARGVGSTFFVMPRRAPGKRSGAREYQRLIGGVLALLREAGREIGIHGTDGDCPDPAALGHDRRDLSQRARSDVRGMRYHYLACLYHSTLPVLDEAGLEYDSSLAFAEREGFRCGASFPFHPYDLERERPLRLLELPLAAMDTSLIGQRYRALDAEAAERACRDVLARVRGGGGGVAVLWHNTRFDHRSAQGYDDVYWRLIEWAKTEGALVASAGELVRRWRERTERPT